MSKIAVVYWSGTGNTEMMAEKVVEGAKGIRSKRSTNREACRWAMI